MFSYVMLFILNDVSVCLILENVVGDKYQAISSALSTYLLH